jgi:hypothetical protein
MTATQRQNRRLGYNRVSNYGQTLDAQLEELRSAGCTNRNIYREKVTGARADRRELLRMLDSLDAGDVVTVTRIDRLARSTFDLLGIIKRILDAKVESRSLAEPWADTGTRRLMLAVLGGKTGAAPRPKGSIWADPLPHPGTAERGHQTPRGALRCRNWRKATIEAYPPCAVRPAPPNLSAIGPP